MLLCRESLVRMNGGFVVHLPLFVLAALNNRMMKNILFDEGRVSFNNKHCGVWKVFHIQEVQKMLVG